MEGTLSEAVRVTVAESKTQDNAFTVSFQSHGSRRPPKVGAETVDSPIFFDVYVEGLTGGTATVSITHDTVTNSHRIHHWNGTKWVDHAERKVDGKTIRAQFDVADLHGTPIVIGTMRVGGSVGG
jgi:hypothetical protein